MSTNKTPNLNLHAWSKTDPVQLSEFNENFAALDAAIAPLQNQIVLGSYTGNGASTRTVNLGFAPAFVILLGYHGETSFTANITIAGPSFAFYIRSECGATEYVRTTDTGFKITSSYYHNGNGRTERYIAFKA